MIPLREILDQFACRYKFFSSSEIQSFRISTVGLGVNFLAEGKQSYSYSYEKKSIITGYALIVHAQDFLQFLEKGKNIFWPEVFLVLDDVGDNTLLARAEEYYGQKNESTIIVLQSKLNAEELYLYCINKINEESGFMDKLISNHYIHLANLLTQDVEVGEIEEVANKILGNPMIITDESYKVIVHSKKVEVDDPIWSTIIGNTYCPATIVEMTDHNQFWQRLKAIGRPLFVDSADFSPYIRRAVAEIKSGGKTKGYIALLEKNKEITERDLFVLQMVAELIGVKLKEKDAVSKAIGQMENEFISDLLAGSMKNEKMAQNRAQSLGWKITQSYLVLCVHGKEKERYIGPILENIKIKLLSLFPFCVHSLHGEVAYFIVGSNEVQKLQFFQMKKLERFLDEANLICYVGLPYHSLLEVSHSYTQANNSLKAIQLLAEETPKRSLYSYSEMAVYDLLLKLLQSGDGNTLSSRNLLSLKRIDERDGSEYVLTLRHFFDNNQNVPATANSMFLHRNTVNYRLNKIRELMDDDFDNSSVRLHIQLSLMMLDLGLLK